MKDIVFLTLPDARYGFTLAGIRHQILGPEEAEKVLLAVLQEPGVGVVVIDERLVRKIPEEKLVEMENRWPGVVVVLPAPEKPEIEEIDYALRLVRRALGYQVRLNL